MAHEDLFTHQLQSVASPYAQMASMESPVCVCEPSNKQLACLIWDAV